MTDFARRFVLLLIFALGAGTTVASAQSQVWRPIYEGSIQISADQGTYKIPLPPGKWSMAAVAENDQNAQGQGPEKTPSDMVKLILVQATGGQLYGVISIQVAVSKRSSELESLMCDKASGVLRYAKAMAGDKTEGCSKVLIRDVFARASSGIWRTARQFLMKTGVKYPYRMIGFEDTSQRADFGYLQVQYFFDASQWDMKISSRGSEMTPISSSTTAQINQREPRLVQKLFDYARRYAVALDLVATSGASPISIRKFEPGSQQDSKSAQTQKTSLTQGRTLDDICAAIGFRLNTEAHQSCVEELESRGLKTQADEAVTETIETTPNKSENPRATDRTESLELNPGSRVYVENTENSTELDLILAQSVAVVKGVESSMAMMRPPTASAQTSTASTTYPKPTKPTVKPQRLAANQPDPTKGSLDVKQSSEVIERPVTTIVAKSTARPNRALKINGLQQKAGAWPVAQKASNIFGAKGPDGSAWRGLVFKAPEGTPVRSIADGKVMFAQKLRTYGNLIVVDHGKNFMSVYAYNDKLTRRVGDLVKAGDPIALIGNTGPLVESALYLEVRRDNKPLNPSLYLRAR